MAPSKLTYHPDLPEACPPIDAPMADQTIYRSVRELPIADQHFLSDVENGRARSDPTICDHWGCSVWPTLKAAEHGRSLFRFFRKSYLVAGKLDPTDGQLRLSPSAQQPEHTTFWKALHVSVSAKFSVIMDPE